MITGRGGGSGKYSYRETHGRGDSVLVSHMPEDLLEIRIVFRSQGENSLPILKLSMNSAELLWASLNQMAKDLNWNDKMEAEKIAQDEKHDA